MVTSPSCWRAVVAELAALDVGRVAHEHDTRRCVVAELLLASMPGSCVSGGGDLAELLAVQWSSRAPSCWTHSARVAELHEVAAGADARIEVSCTRWWRLEVSGGAAKRTS
jgi:hypothetical protein